MGTSMYDNSSVAVTNFYMSIILRICIGHLLALACDM